MNCPPTSSISKFLLSTLFAICLLLIVSIQSASSATIDVMIVYDTTATTWVEDNGGMSAFSLDAVNRMNLAVQNSDVDITFRLVHSVSAAYTHQDLSSDLSAIVYGTDGFSNIDTLRDNYGADLVALLIDTGSAYGTTGLGYVLNRYSGSPNYAFTASSIRSVAISHTLTHEVGHNLGGGHSISQSSYPGPNDDLASYAAGWYFTGTNGKDYYTIMSYSDDGTQSYKSAPLFSSPLLTYEGTTAGNAKDGDNSRIFRDTMDVVANYKDAKGMLSVSIEPESAQTDGAQWRRTGTATWHDSGDVEIDLNSDQYVVEFKTMDGWEEPTDITADVYAGETTSTSGTYTAIYEPVGSLSVTIDPTTANADGAQWRRTGTATWYGSEFVEEYLPVGQYSVEFDEVNSWEKPDDITVEISDEETTLVTGTYSIIYVPVGSLNVTILPPEAVTAGAQWRREGTDTWYNSGSSESNVDTGEYTLEFKTIDGWVIPAEMTVDVSDGQTTSASGTYGTYIDKNPTQRSPKAMPWILLLLE